MAVRNVFRSKQRSLLAITGIACSFSMMVAMGAIFDSVYHSIDFQFGLVDSYDIKVNLQNYAHKRDGTSSMGYLKGVKKAEPLLEAPVTISHMWLEKDINIYGLPGSGSLYRLMTDKEEEVNLPSDGMIISEQLADELSVRAGDTVTVKPFAGDREERTIKVRNIVSQYAGMRAYMEIDALGKLLGLPPAATAVVAIVDNDNMTEIRKELQEGKNVRAINEKNRVRQKVTELFDGLKVWLYIMWIFSFILGFALIYNLNIISLSERVREMATLKVVGLTDKEIIRILQ